MKIHKTWTRDCQLDLFGKNILYSWAKEGGSCGAVAVTGGHSGGRTRAHPWLEPQMFAAPEDKMIQTSQNKIGTAARRKIRSAYVLTHWSRSNCSQKWFGFGVFFSSFGRMEKEGNVQVFRLCSGRRAGWGEVAGKKIIREVRLLIKCGFWRTINLLHWLTVILFLSLWGHLLEVSASLLCGV